jgi:hypothetical protein
MIEEYIPGMSDAVVRTIPSDDVFRLWLAEFGIGHHAAPTIGREIANMLARKWHLVLVEKDNV